MNTRKTHLIILLLLSQLFGYSQQTEGIVCEIRSDKQVYNIGEIPEISISIKNNTDSVFYLVKALDASYAKIRYPHSYFTIELIEDSTYQLTKLERCGAWDGISQEDFVLINPGEEFNPYKNQSPVYSEPNINHPKNFKNTGDYRIVYHYSTMETNLKKWMSWDVEWRWFELKSEVKPTLKTKYDRLQELFSLVPKIEIESNEVVITIK